MITEFHESERRMSRTAVSGSSLSNETSGGQKDAVQRKTQKPLLHTVDTAAGRARKERTDNCR